MHYFIFRKDFKGLTYLLNKAPQYVYVSLQCLEEVLVMHMIYTLSLKEFSLHVIELLAQTMRSDFIDQPVVLGLIDVINELSNVFYPWELLRIYSIAYFTIGLSREQRSTEVNFYPCSGVYTVGLGFRELF